MIDSRQIALKGVGKSSRIFAAAGLIFLTIPIVNEPIPWRGVNARLPQYLITPAGGRFKRIRRT